MSEEKKNLVKMAYIYSQEGRWDKAINEYKKLLKLDPEDYNTYSMLGDVHVKKAEIQPAFDAYLTCSDAYVRLGQTEKATVVQRKMAKLDSAQLSPESRKKQAIFQRQVEGEAAMEAGELDKAVDAFKAVLELDPDRFDLYQRLGDLYLRKGDTAQAIKQYNDIGEIYYKNKLYKKAAPIYKKVVELDPENVDAHAAMGEIHARSGNESDAKKEYLLLAETLLHRGDLENALNFAKKAVVLKSIEAYYYLGQVFFLQDKLDDAKAEFDKLLKFKLNHAGALVSMGRIHEKKGALDDALSCFEKVLKVEKANPEALVGSASVLSAKGQAKEGAERYRSASEAWQALGKTSEAEKCSALAIALDPTAAAPNTEAVPGAAPLVEIESAPVTQAPEPAPIQTVAQPAVTPPVAAQLPPLPVVQAQAPSPLPPLPAANEADLEPPDSGDDLQALLALAGNFVAEGASDEAIGVYQRVLDQDPGNQAAKNAMAGVYSKLAKGAGDAARQVAEEAARAQAEKDAALRAEQAAREAVEAGARQEKEAAQRRQADEAAALKQLEQEARSKVEAEFRQKADDEARAKQQVELRKNLEAEIRRQLEDEMRKKVEEEVRQKAEEDLKRKVEDARRLAEEDARRQSETEVRRQFEEEKKKLEAENAESKRRLEEELRKRITEEVQKKQDQETEKKVEAVRMKEEKDGRQKMAEEVLARVQSQQQQKQSVYQKTIDDIRKKVEEQAAPSKPPAAGPARGAGKPEPEVHDELDDFMTVAVADIYTKQGLVNEARRIYERLLKRDPGDMEIRRKLDQLTSGKPAVAAPAPAAPAATQVANEEAAPETAKKKSKVSYL